MWENACAAIAPLLEENARLRAITEDLDINVMARARDTAEARVKELEGRIKQLEAALQMIATSQVGFAKISSFSRLALAPAEKPNA